MLPDPSIKILSCSSARRPGGGRIFIPVRALTNYNSRISILRPFTFWYVMYDLIYHSVNVIFSLSLYKGTGVAFCNVATGEETVRWLQKWPGRANAVENKVCHCGAGAAIPLAT